MITFGLNYDVKKEYVERFVKVSREALGVIERMKGHVKTSLYSNVEKPSSFLIYSEWETFEDFRNFMLSKEFKAVQTMGAEMLERRPSHKVYETRSMDRVA